MTSSHALAPSVELHHMTEPRRSAALGGSGRTGVWASARGECGRGLRDKGGGG